MTSPQQLPNAAESEPAADSAPETTAVSAADSAPDLDRTVRLDAVTADDSATLLDSSAWPTPAAGIPVAPARVSLLKNGDADATVVLDAVVVDAVTVELAEPPVEPTVAHPAPAPLQAPDPVPAHEPLAPGELRRFGPGVPAAAVAVPALAAAVWHGDATAPAQPGADAPVARRRRRALGGWLLPIVVLLAVLAYLAWQRWTPAVRVTGVAVSSDAAGPACDGTAVVTGTLETDGGAGTVRYRWERSDGTVSDELSQPVARGSHRTDVVLRWTFDGHGTMRATATLDVLSPQARSASTSFTYTCH
ncbi:hypothetical protein [Kitasatospora mediocidica]|uniref:hypothetical protein n=1 Tax=Kitasatospora mediocidica TaxID=58352 RepID=UPI00068CAC08|nr:hypothetical protein [Kitasatospora mediocidica]